LLLNLFFPEVTSSIPDVLRNPRVDFFFPEEIFLSPRRPPASQTWFKFGVIARCK
jgi:hypothetical protein